jgi:regulator of cell morphogenesis and NO signaling
MNDNAFIDVTKMEPRLKHPAIFNAFDQLDEGESIILHNDHDPKPVYYQLLGLKGNCFTWAYKVKGPQIWEVEIKKSMADSQETIGMMVRKDIRKADVFKRFGIDFCCGGKKTLQAACTEKGLDVLLVKDELEKLSSVYLGQPAQNYDEWQPDFLADYIVNVHHAFVKKNIPVVRDMALKVSEHHGKTNEELFAIKEAFDAVANELLIHMKKEEHVLFPYIKQLARSKNNAEERPSGFASVNQPISVMENDHDIAGEILSEIRKLSNNFTPPANACNSYMFLYHKLEEFEDDLHMHVHLENNILFPKAISLESELNQVGA